MSKYISLPKICEAYHKNQAYISKLIKVNKVKTINARRRNGRPCKAILLSDWVKLVQEITSLASKPLSNKDVTLEQAAKILSMDKSNLRKLIVSLNLKIKYRSTGKTRAITCITKEELGKVKAERGELPIVN